MKNLQTRSNVMAGSRSRREKKFHTGAEQFSDDEMNKIKRSGPESDVLR
jgi:hypothetical protein